MVMVTKVTIVTFYNLNVNVEINCGIAHVSGKLLNANIFFSTFTVKVIFYLL